jgi:hypothetical protein
MTNPRLVIPVFAQHYSKQPDGSWVPREYRGLDATIPLPAIECELHLGRLHQYATNEPETGLE